jgi:hypothetical protein
MSDAALAAEAARVAAENEASREISAQAAPDNPNPETPQAPPQPAPVPASGESRDDAAPLERITGADKSRAEIAARFKAKRAAQGGEVEFHGDMRDPSQTYGPYGLAPAPPADEQRTGQDPAQPQPVEARAQTVEPAAPAVDAPATAEEPRLVKVKVHGREMFLPEDQVIAEAQKSLAAGNLLESAKEVLSTARQPAQPGTAEEPPPEAPAGPDYTDLAATLQLEPDAQVAGSKLKQTIEAETSRARQEAAREAARAVRIENELAASQRAMAAFEQAHPDLATDEFARDAVTTQVQREINADLKAALDQGILKELPRTQDERNSLHTQLRAFGAPVRAMGDIFTAAGTKYQSWRGATPAPRPASDLRPTPVPQPAPTAPRVELTTARQERRANLPTQPTNGTAPPRPAPPPEQTTAGRRSAAIMAMRKARGQIVA